MQKQAGKRLRAPLTLNSLQVWLKTHKPGHTTHKKGKVVKFIMHNGVPVAHGRTWRELAAKVGMPA